MMIDHREKHQIHAPGSQRQFFRVRGDEVCRTVRRRSALSEHLERRIDADHRGMVAVSEYLGEPPRPTPEIEYAADR